MSGPSQRPMAIGAPGRRMLVTSVSAAPNCGLEMWSNVLMVHVVSNVLFSKDISQSEACRVSIPRSRQWRTFPAERSMPETVRPTTCIANESCPIPVPISMTEVRSSGCSRVAKSSCHWMCCGCGLRAARCGVGMS
jgi:hypothetical protein